ncbi:MAG: Crp/Fnr family transcriptional regulator [Deltaproteobacteria bacterium]|nr:Crp/Fnr family transcriptional regulator [Deltaproteobacteria bacterium]
MATNPQISYSPHRSEVFKGLTGEQVANLVKEGRRIKLEPKNILFHQGDPAKNCFLVNRGRLKLTKLNEQGKEVILRYIVPGELTAATAVLKNWAYPVTAEAIEETDVIVWDKPAMMQLMRRYPDIAINLLGIILERIDDVQNRYLEVCTEHVDQRIARSLLRLMRRAGSKTPEGIHIDIPLSRQNIADYSGTTLYTVSRTLSAWEKKGWIQSGREQIIVTDPHALVQFSETG